MPPPLHLLDVCVHQGGRGVWPAVPHHQEAAGKGGRGHKGEVGCIEGEWCVHACAICHFLFRIHASCTHTHTHTHTHTNKQTNKQTHAHAHTHAHVGSHRSAHTYLLMLTCRTRTVTCCPAWCMRPAGVASARHPPSHPDAGPRGAYRVSGVSGTV